MPSFIVSSIELKKIKKKHEEWVGNNPKEIKNREQLLKEFSGIKERMSVIKKALNHAYQKRD